MIGGSTGSNSTKADPMNTASCNRPTSTVGGRTPQASSRAATSVIATTVRSRPKRGVKATAMLWTSTTRSCSHATLTDVMPTETPGAYEALRKYAAGDSIRMGVPHSRRGPPCGGRCVEWDLDHRIDKQNRSIYVEWENWGHRLDPTRNRHMYWCADLGLNWGIATDDDQVMVHSHRWEGSAIPHGDS